MGIGAASEAVNMAGRPDFSKGLSVGYKAAEQAYKMAGVGPKDIDVAEVTIVLQLLRLWRTKVSDLPNPVKARN